MYRKNIRPARLIALTLTLAVAGCSSLDLGPEPSNYVGPRSAGAELLTDPSLGAVTPAVSGATPSGTKELTGTGGAVIPETMPSATEPTTTEPSASTNPAAHSSVGTGETVGQTKLPPGAFEPSNELTLEDAIIDGLQYNTGLVVDRLNVPIVRTAEETQRAAFDPVVSGGIGEEQSATPLGIGPNGFSTSTFKNNSVVGNLGITEYLPTGTTIAGNVTTNNSFYGTNNANNGGAITVTQRLLQGAGLDVNLASLRQAEIDTKVSQYELRAQAELLAATIEKDYWDLAYAERQVIIVQNALDLAQSLLDETNEMIQVQRKAESERAAAVAQVAQERSDLITAKTNLETKRLNLLSLLAPTGQPFWKRTIIVKTLPFIPVGVMDPVDKHVEVGLQLREDLNQARLQLQRGDLDVVFTKNGLLPELDFFIILGKTGYANEFGDTFREFNGPDYDAQVGVTGSYPLGNRAPRAAYRKAILNRDVLKQSMENFAQTVQVDVRTQYITVESTRQQIDATRATRIAEEEAVRVETEKYRLGRSTTILVAQAQNTLLTDQLAEVLAVTTHLQALVDLYRLEGSLLYRRGIQAPGGKPVAGIAWH